MYKVDNFINGESNSDSNKSSKIINPSYGKQIGEVAYATKESTDSFWLLMRKAKNIITNKYTIIKLYKHYLI